jgi:hypothetical protein
VQKQIASEPILRREDLSAQEGGVLAGLVAEDEVFYGRFEAVMGATPLPYVLGSAL